MGSTSRGFISSLQKNPALTIPEFLASEETFYKVTVPQSGHFELPKNYPWMVKAEGGGKIESWEISFARSACLEDRTKRQEGFKSRD